MTDFVKVPREATPEMYEAARKTYLLGETPFFEKIWAAMLAAAPPPQPEPGWQEERAATIQYLGEMSELVGGDIRRAICEIIVNIQAGDHRPAPPKETT